MPEKGIRKFENCKTEKKKKISEVLQNELKCLKMVKLSFGAPLY